VPEGLPAPGDGAAAVKSQLYQPRRYREAMRPAGSVCFSVLQGETDLWISAGSDLSGIALREVVTLRGQLQQYIAQCPLFLHSLVPLPEDAGAPPLIREMLAAGTLAHVGPMAAVAGAISEAVGRALLGHSSEVIIENGGDLFVRRDGPCRILVHAGTSPLSDKIALEIDSGGKPFGLATSSGTVGHSLSFGNADAACVLADSAAVADAYATAIGNMVKTKDDIDPALAYVRTQPLVKGCAIIIGESIGIWGELRVVALH
jgi:uncharacterized protein